MKIMRDTLQVTRHLMHCLNHQVETFVWLILLTLEPSFNNSKPKFETNLVSVFLNMRFLKSLFSVFDQSHYCRTLVNTFVLVPNKTVL